MNKEQQSKTYLRNGSTFRVTVSDDSKGWVEFSPAGGGFISRMRSDEFHKQHALETQAPKLVLAYFGGDWSEKVFPGYNREGFRWNGWGMPLFTKAVAQAVAIEMQDLKYNLQNDSFDIPMDGELDQFKGEDVDVPDQGPLRLYAIGAGSWCWDHYASLAEIGKTLSVFNEVIDEANQSTDV
jgi:hypothetical protein